MLSMERSFINFYPDFLQAFGNLEFSENCPVTVLTAEALSEIPLPSDYLFPYPGNPLTPASTDFIQLCQSLVPDLGSQQPPYILGGEVKWVYPSFQRSKIDLTCVASRPCAETSEFIIAVAKCAFSSLRMPVSLTNEATQFKFGENLVLGSMYPT